MCVEDNKSAITYVLYYVPKSYVDFITRVNVYQSQKATKSKSVFSSMNADLS